MTLYDNITTEAGRRLLDVLDGIMAVVHGIATADLPENIATQAKTPADVLREMTRLIVDIETEAREMTGTEAVNLRVRIIEQRAVAAERARIAEAVLRRVTHDAVAERMRRVGRPWTVGEAIKATVDAVLALLEPTDD